MTDRDVLLEIQRSLGRVEGKLETFDDRFDQLDRVEKRVGSLEGWRKWTTGAQAVIVAVFAWLVR